MTQDRAARESSFDGFCRMYLAQLNALAGRLTDTREDADDVVSLALAAAWENWDRVCAATVPIAYVRRMVTNLAADQVGRLARERRRTQGPLGERLGEHVGEHLGGAYELPDVGAQLELRFAVAGLPSGQRSCVVLRHLLGFSPEETSAVLGISTGTVKSQTSRGLDQLRRALQSA